MSMSEKLNLRLSEKKRRREGIEPERDAKLYLLLADKAENATFDKRTGMFSVPLDAELITPLRIAYPINPNLLTIENPSMSIPGFESGQLRIEGRFGAYQETVLLYSPELKLALESMNPLFTYDANPDNRGSTENNFPKLDNVFRILPTGKSFVAGNYTYQTYIDKNDTIAVQFKRSPKEADDIATYPTLHDFVQVVMENARREFEKLSRSRKKKKKNIANENPFRMETQADLRYLPAWLRMYIFEIEKNRYHLGQNDLGKAHRAAERRERIKKIEYAIVAILVLALPYLDLAEKKNFAYADLAVILVILIHLFAIRGEPSASVLAQQIKEELKEIDRNI